MNGRLRPTSTMSPRRSTVIVTDEPSGTFVNVVTGSAGAVWFCARAVAATANIAVPLMSARRPTTFGDPFCIHILDARCYLERPSLLRRVASPANAGHHKSYRPDRRPRRSLFLDREGNATAGCRLTRCQSMADRVET